MNFVQPLVIFVLFISVAFVQSSKILSVTFFASTSFRNAFDPLFFELAERGHNLTIINPINPPKKHANIREINLPPKEKQSLESSKFSNFFQRRKEKEVTNIILAGPIILDSCRQFLEMKEVQELISEKFDLIIGVGLGNECSFGYIHQFNTSSILVSPITPIFPLTSFIGTPAPRSFVPSAFSGHSDYMNFFERIDNLLKTTWYTLYFNWIYLPTMDTMNRQFFGPETPSVVEIAKNTSLVLVNSHLAVNYPRPFMPDIIDIGGAYCRPAKPLPKDIEDFVSSAQHGFIYFSMGSVLQGSSMSPEVQKIFVSVFGKLKQKVLWKWESDMNDKPENVMLLKWAPQPDILGHKNIRLFITHSGGLSTSEAIYNGVPILGIPMFGDQDYNIKVAENKQFGLKLELGEITESLLMTSIRQVLDDPKYSETAKTLSSVFRDRITQPLDTAVYWIEYVIRHRGARHLRSSARDLNFFQYYSIDVVLFLGSVALVILLIGCKIFKLILNIIFTKNTAVSAKRTPSKKKIKVK